ncbi:MAG: M81 family metallopeptidase [Caldilineaceae bacterium]
MTPTKRWWANCWRRCPAGLVDGLLLALRGDGGRTCPGPTPKPCAGCAAGRPRPGGDARLCGNVNEELVRDATALMVKSAHRSARTGNAGSAHPRRTIRSDVRAPTQAIAKPNLLFNIAFHNTSKPPMQPLMQAAIALEDQPGVLACSIAAGYQYASDAGMGPSMRRRHHFFVELAQRRSR